MGKKCNHKFEDDGDNMQIVCKCGYRSDVKPISFQGDNMSNEYYCECGNELEITRSGIDNFVSDLGHCNKCNRYYLNDELPDLKKES